MYEVKVFPAAAKSLLQSDMQEYPVWFSVDLEQRRASQESVFQGQT